MADKKLGLKRLCGECEKRFYDLEKSPAVCPLCGHENRYDKEPEAAAPAETAEKPVAAAAAPLAESEETSTDDAVEVSKEVLVEEEEENNDDEPNEETMPLAPSERIVDDLEKDGNKDEDDSEDSDESEDSNDEDDDSAS